MKYILTNCHLAEHRILSRPASIPATLSLTRDLADPLPPESPFFNYLNLEINHIDNDKVLATIESILYTVYPANTKHLYNICTALVQRLRRDTTSSD